MAGKHGTAELREFVLFFKTVLLRAVVEHKTDGFQASDLSDLLADPQVVEDLFRALEGADKVDDELKDLDFMDGLELSRFIYSCVMEIVTELRK